MRKKRPALTPQQIASLIKECVGSAHDLYLSGVILNHQGPAPTARALLILALEEYGKIGWLCRVLMLPLEADAEWGEWWDKFRSHPVKNEIGRMMMVHGGLLPILAPFFRDRFPFFSLPPVTLDRHKQAMLYVDFDDESGECLSPRKYMETYSIDNRLLIGDVEQVVRYVARNNEAGVFEPPVTDAYGQLNQLARDEPDRFALLRLFYATVLRRQTGQVEEMPFDQVIRAVRKRHPGEADELLREWTDLGATLHERTK